MPYTPQFGATNGVGELDIGQTGSVRRGAGTALATIRTNRDEDQNRVAENGLPQQNVIYRDLLGFGGRPVFWRGDLRTTTETLIGTIEAELDSYRTGQKYTPGGTFDAFDISRIRPTRLTNGFGRVISDHAILQAWQWTSDILRISSSSFLYYVKFEIVFNAAK